MMPVSRRFTTVVSDLGQSYLGVTLSLPFSPATPSPMDLQPLLSPLEDDPGHVTSIWSACTCSATTTRQYRLPSPDVTTSLLPRVLDFQQEEEEDLVATQQQILSAEIPNLEQSAVLDSRTYSWDSTTVRDRSSCDGCKNPESSAHQDLPLPQLPTPEKLMSSEEKVLSWLNRIPSNPEKPNVDSRLQQKVATALQRQRHLRSRKSRSRARAESRARALHPISDPDFHQPPTSSYLPTAPVGVATMPAVAPGNPRPATILTPTRRRHLSRQLKKIGRYFHCSGEAPKLHLETLAVL